jgi:3-oxoacyl-[acyl-carrier protein] reductase
MMRNERQLPDKVALVCGGSKGIGAAIVTKLAADGASVALTYAKSPEKAAETARAAETHGRVAIAIKADSADPEAVRDAVAQTIARFGRLDILVVNSGILIRGMVDRYDLADFGWRRMYAVSSLPSKRPRATSRMAEESSPSAATQPSGPHFLEVASIR